MKTYGLAKDYRHKLYIVIFVVSLIIYGVVDYFLLSKIVVKAEFYIIVRIMMSTFSISLISAVLLTILNKLYTKYNSYNGTYYTITNSSYKGESIDGCLMVRVTLFMASIIVKTGNSISQSETIFIDNSDATTKTITYTYLNDGNLHGKAKLLMHRGTGILIFNKKGFIEGKYYNDENRKTYGTIELNNNHNELNIGEQ